MSAAQNLKSKLDTLECHFTWDLNPSAPQLYQIKHNLEDIGTEEGTVWQGHVYNLQGFLQYKLDLTEEAKRFFSRATEAYQQVNATDEGPWLVVNYGNLAWLHHQLGEDEKSQDFLSKVNDLINKYPSPVEGEPHQEVYAEKAWTLMKFNKEKKLLAADYFQKALGMQPDVVQWQTSYWLLKATVLKQNTENLDADMLKKMKSVKERDPENLYLAAFYLEVCAAKEIIPEHEVRKLAERVLMKPASSYSGIAPLLQLYRQIISVDEAVELAEEALRRHPDARFIKKCAAVCYKYKVYKNPDRRTVDRAISLFREVIEAYPHSSLKTKITIADMYAKSDPVKAHQIYEELLKSQKDLVDLDPVGAQMLYHYYARHLFFNQKEMHKSIKYHMKVAEIPEESWYHEKSIRELEKMLTKNKNPEISEEISELLEKLSVRASETTTNEK